MTTRTQGQTLPCTLRLLTPSGQLYVRETTELAISRFNGRKMKLTGNPEFHTLFQHELEG